MSQKNATILCYKLQSNFHNFSSAKPVANLQWSCHWRSTTAKMCQYTTIWSVNVRTRSLAVAGRADCTASHTIN